MNTIGSIIVSTVFELDASQTIRDVISKATPENIKNIPWLAPTYADDAGNLKAVNQSFLLRTPSGNAIIDTCVGNGRSRPELPAWDGLHTGYLENLQKEINPNDVDYIICTHLHFDHIGWNTMLINGIWRPVFPNAKYVFVKDEFDYWMTSPQNELVDDRNGIEESIKPLLETVQVLLVAADAQVTPEIRLIPTPGHTPHHVSVLVESDGESALFTGDVFHHPCQIAEPEWMSFDTDEASALQSRRKVLSEYGGTATMVYGAHFSQPAGGRIVQDDQGYRLEH